MQKKILSLFLGLSILVMSNMIVTQKAHALAGLAFRSKVVKTIGGIGTGAGVTVFGVGILIAKVGTGIEALFWSLTALVYGPIIAAIGLVILDDKTVVDLEYQPIDLLDTSAHDQFALDEIQMYNAEVEELNAIRKTIQVQVSDDGKNIDEAKKLWDEYSVALHPATIKIAEKKAADFINHVQKFHGLN